MADMTPLLEDQTSDTTQTADGTLDTDAVQVSKFYSAVDKPVVHSGHLTVIAVGTFEGVTAEIEIAPTASGPWIAVSDLQFTEAGSQATLLSSKAWIRPKVSGTGSPAPSVSIYVG